MPSDIEFFDEFPELLLPDVNWGKEVLAHFGLLFSGYALLEASLQNCVIYWKKIDFLKNLDKGKSFDELVLLWELEHDKTESLAIASTFGSLLKMLKSCAFLDKIRHELTTLKVKRDYFAHHFFRETATFHTSDALRLRMIQSMHLLRLRTKKAEHATDAAASEMFAQLYPKTDLDALVKAEVDQQKLKLRLVRKDDEVCFGWEDEDAL